MVDKKDDGLEKRMSAPLGMLPDGELNVVESADPWDDDDIIDESDNGDKSVAEAGGRKIVIHRQ